MSTDKLIDSTLRTPGHDCYSMSGIPCQLRNVTRQLLQNQSSSASTNFGRNGRGIQRHKSRGPCQSGSTINVCAKDRLSSCTSHTNGKRSLYPGSPLQFSVDSCFMPLAWDWTTSTTRCRTGIGKRTLCGVLVNLGRVFLDGHARLRHAGGVGNTQIRGAPHVFGGGDLRCPRPCAP